MGFNNWKIMHSIIIKKLISKFILISLKKGLKVSIITIIIIAIKDLLALMKFNYLSKNLTKFYLKL